MTHSSHRVIHWREFYYPLLGRLPPNNSGTAMPNICTSLHLQANSTLRANGYRFINGWRSGRQGRIEFSQFVLDGITNFRFFSYGTEEISSAFGWLNPDGIKVQCRSREVPA
jgi:hypothetical protein